jgi:hypothetical protein
MRTEKLRGWQKTLVTASVALLACGTGLGVFGGPAANADGTPGDSSTSSTADTPVTLTEARTQLTALKTQVDDLQTQLSHSEDVMNEALVNQASLQSEVDAQQAKIADMAPAFADMVNSSRQANNLGSAIQFLLNDTPEQFLNHMDVTAVVQTALNQQMAQLGSEKQKLDDLNAQLAVTVQTSQTEVATQTTLLAQQQAAETQAQALVNKLSAAQRVALGSALVNLNGVQPQTTNMIEVILGLFPMITDVGTMRAGTGSDHCYGLAADFMIPDYKNNVDLGWQLANYAKDHAKQLDVKYIIWQQSIWETILPDRGWRPMADRGSDTANHYDHVHISMNAT